ncbi:MAG: hypothetical protein QME40_08030 [bacterium]|nr:hypothetical protein [bacterium]
MKYLKIISILFLIFVGLFGFFQKINAQFDLPLKLELNQTSFKPGNTLKVTAKLFNIFDYPSQFDLNVILAPSQAEEIFPIMPFHQEILLEPQQKKDIEVCSFLVREDFPGGEWRLNGELRMGEQKLGEDSTTFTITGVLKEMKLEIKICRDPACTEKPKTILQNEEIYLTSESDVPETQIEARLIFPDQTIKSISLPASLTVEKSGTYVFEVIAFKKGYKTQTQRIEFGVIKKEAEIPSTEICNANGICEADRGENYQNCPQDCISPEVEEVIKKIEEEMEKKTAQRKKYYIVGGILVLIAIGINGIEVYFYLRKRFLTWKIK